MPNESQSLLEVRLREIAREEERLTQRLRELHDEKRDLEIAKRVLARLHGPAESQGHHIGARAAAEDGGAKPDGTPTVPEMISEVLADVQRIGMKGLEPALISDSIAKKWWPDVRRESISSIAWRMWKRGQLEKDGPLYRLPKEIATPGTLFAEEPGASDMKPISRPVEPVPGGGT